MPGFDDASSQNVLDDFCDYAAALDVPVENQQYGAATRWMLAQLLAKKKLEWEQREGVWPPRGGGGFGTDAIRTRDG